MIYYIIAAVLTALGIWYLAYWWKYLATATHKNFTIWQTILISIGTIIMAAVLSPLTIIDMIKFYRKEKRKIS